MAKKLTKAELAQAAELKVGPDDMVRVIALADIENPRVLRLRELHHYYNNTPPFPILAAEDPDVDKPRVAVGLAGDVVKKRTGFLVGEDKFRGPAVIEFEDEGFGEMVQKVWDDNRADGKILSFIKDMHWAGFAAWKITTDPLAKRKKIRFNRVRPSSLYVEFLPGDDKTQDAVKAWIIMFPKGGTDYYREEIYADKILYYEGKPSTPEEVQAYLGIEEEGYAAITFRLYQKEENDMGIHTLAFIARENEESIWGKSIITSIRDRIDRVNEIYTNALFAIAKCADPVLWASGAKDVASLHRDADTIWYFEDPKAALNTLTWEGVPESTITIIQRISDQIYKESDVPLLLKADASIGDIPARSLEILYADTKNAVQMDRSNFSDWILDLLEIIFEVLAVTKDLGKGILEGSAGYSSFNFKKINWGDIIPTDKSKKRDDVLKLYKADTVDKLEVLLQSGYSMEEAEAILERMKKEKSEAADSLPGDVSEFDIDEDNEDEDGDEDLLDE